MGDKSESLHLQVECNIEVDPLMIEVLCSSDIFQQGCIGYWARGKAVTEEGGRFSHWLVAEEDELLDSMEGIFDSHPGWGTDEVIDFVLGNGLEPKKFIHVMDREKRLEVVACGCRRLGAGFQEEYDYEDLDIAIQQALLGEVRYG